MHFGDSINCIVSSQNSQDRRAHLCTQLMHFATFKYQRTEQQREITNIKQIRLSRINMTKIVKTNGGKVLGIFEDNQMLRIIKDFQYHLYIFDTDRGYLLLHFKREYFKAARFYGMFKSNLGIPKLDMVVFVFRRNQAIFLKLLNVQNLQSNDFILNLPLA